MPINDEPVPAGDEEPVFFCGEFKAERSGATVLLTILLPPRSDHEFHRKLSQGLLVYLRRVQPTHVVVSFEIIPPFNSQFISTLLRLRREQESRGGDVRLCCLSEFHHEVFRIVDPKRRLFPIYDTVADAWQACKA